MSSVLRLPASQLDAIPAELRAIPRFVCWEKRFDDKDPDKPKKIPIQARAQGRMASSTDPRTWATFAEAVATLQANPKLTGIGFAFDDSDDIAGVDLDGCRDPSTGVIAPWALAIITELDSYTEVSQSGTGVHIICHGKVPAGGHKRDVMDEHGQICGVVEMYDNRRYFTCTGQHLAGTPNRVEECADALARVHARYIAPAERPLVAKASTPTGVRLPSAVTESDAVLLEKARSATNGEKFSALFDDGDYNACGYGSPSEADFALCRHLRFWTGADAARMDALFRSSALMREKWLEKHGDRTYGQITIANALARGGDVFNSNGPRGPTAKTAKRGFWQFWQCPSRAI
ncbi:MAG: hypothetical protein ACR2G6_05835 [Gemmatimonadaceae bacterium]